MTTKLPFGEKVPMSMSDNEGFLDVCHNMTNLDICACIGILHRRPKTSFNSGKIFKIIIYFLYCLICYTYKYIAYIKQINIVQGGGGVRVGNCSL